MATPRKVTQTTRASPFSRKPPRVPLKRAVNAMDVMLLQEYCDIPLMKMAFFLGNYGQRYQELMQPGAQDQPIRNASRALLVRTVIDMINDGRHFNPEYALWDWALMWPRAPKFRELYETYLENLGSGSEAVSKTRFSLFLGVGKHSSIRWEREDNDPHPIVEHLSVYLYADIQERGAVAIDEHVRRVKAEALGRGFASLDDLLRSGTWTNPLERKQRSEATAKAKSAARKSRARKSATTKQEARA